MGPLTPTNANNSIQDIELQVITELADASLSKPRGMVVLYTSGRALTPAVTEVLTSKLGLRTGAITVHVQRLGVASEGAQTILVERARSYTSACSYDFCIGEVSTHFFGQWTRCTC
jgi:hypothetical protein